MPRKVAVNKNRDESSDDDSVQDEKTVKQEKQATEKKTKTKGKATKEEKTVKEDKNINENKNWDEMSDDDHLDNHGGEAQSDDSDDEVHVSCDENDGNDRRSRKKGAKYTNSVINFDYSRYADLETPISELNNKDVLRVLIVRAYKDNQYQLCKSLKHILRATNLECDFPGTTSIRDQRQQSSGPRNNGQSFSRNEQRPDFRNSGQQFRGESNGSFRGNNNGEYGSNGGGSRTSKFNGTRRPYKKDDRDF